MAKKSEGEKCRTAAICNDTGAAAESR